MEERLQTGLRRNGFLKIFILLQILTTFLMEK